MQAKLADWFAGIIARPRAAQVVHSTGTLWVPPCAAFGKGANLSLYLSTPLKGTPPDGIAAGSVPV